MFIRGKVKKIIFQKNGNVIFNLEKLVLGKGEELPIGAKPETGDFIRCIGNYDGLVEGSEVEVEGDFKTNNYKPDNFFAKKQTPLLQFSIKNIEQLMEGNEDILVKNFFIKNIPFVGEKTANIIFEKLSGNQLIDLLSNEEGISKLQDIKGIGKIKAKEIYDGWSKYASQREVLIKLSSYGIGVVLGLKLFDIYKENTLKKIEENPYILTRIKGIGFKKAEKIAIDYFNIPKNSKFRYVAMIDFFINNVTEYGDTLFSLDDLRKEIKDYLLNDDFKYDDDIDTIINIGLSEGIKEDRFSKINENIYMLKYLRDIEEYIFNEIKRRKSIYYKLDLDFNTIENFDKLNLEQKNMLMNTLNKNLSINIGPAGSGKTFTTKAIIDGFKKVYGDKLNICIIAPTNKAVKRIQEVNGKDIESKTIHKLLGLQKGSNTPIYNEINLLPYNVIIIDEAGMMGEKLLELLFKAIYQNTRIIFTGDYNQLSPVNSAGSILYDLIEGGFVNENINILKTIERVIVGKDEVGIGNIEVGINNIIANCRLILDQKFPKQTITTPIFIYNNLDEDYEDKIIEKIFTIYNQMRFKNIDYNVDYQILAPIYNGNVGINNLNKLISSFLNNHNKIIDINGKDFRIGDKIYYNENNLDLGLSKGDTGIIKNIDEKEKNISIKFFDIEEEVKINFMEVGDIDLGYVMSVHKSQGSEYKYVTLILTKGAFSLLNRNLLYTGYSRGKKIVTLLGDNVSIGVALKNSESSRNTLLFNLFKNILFENIELLNDRSNNYITENERKYIQNHLRNIYIKSENKNDKESYSLIKVRVNTKEMLGYNYIFAKKDTLNLLGLKESIIINSEIYEKISFNKLLFFIKIKKGKFSDPNTNDKNKLINNYNHRLLMYEENNKEIKIFNNKNF